MTKLPHGCSASTSLRFVLLTLLALGAGVQQSHAQFDTLKVGTRSYMLVNEEEALEVIQGQTQQLVEYADTVLHLNGVLDLMIDSLGGAEAALVQAVDSILVLDASLETATDSIVALNGVWMTATDSIVALNGFWMTATDSIATLNGVWMTATDSIVTLNGVWSTATDSIATLNGVWTMATDSIGTLNGVWTSAMDSIATLNGVWTTATDSIASLNVVWTTATDSIASLNGVWTTATDSIATLNGVWMSATDSIATLNGVWTSAMDSIATLNGVWVTATDSIATLNAVWATATDSIASLIGVWATATDSIAYLNGNLTTATDSLVALTTALDIATDSLAVLFSVPGCTYSTYLEYNAEATWEDGSCVNLAYPGCMDSDYLEFDEVANVDDGSCATFIVEGCTDYLYAEFDGAANVDDGSCATYLCSTVAMDGYTYDLVQIGDQCWFAENLRTTITSQGTEIPYITNSSDWNAANGGAQNYANNNVNHLNAYGRLYNGYAAWHPEGICPTDWHVSTQADWQELQALQVADGYVNFLGRTLRSVGDWNQPGGSITSTSIGYDTYGFNGLPGGIFTGSSWSYVGSNVGLFWTSTKTSSNRAHTYSLVEWSNGITTSSDAYANGFSIRCVLDRP